MTTTIVPMTNDIAKTMIDQIGRMTVLGISGGRIGVEDDFLVLPVGKGYSVEIAYTWRDDYTVRRVFKRNGVKTVKGEVERVYLDTISDVAYDASCFVNVPFGDHAGDWGTDDQS